MRDFEQNKRLMEAADWVVRAGEEGFSAEEADALNQWRQLDIRNERAYRELTDLWEEIPSAVGEGADPNSACNDNLVQKTEGQNGWVGRASAWLTLATAVAATIILFFVPTLVSDNPTEHFATEVAQVSEIGLSDGSIATLAPKTAVDVEFSKSERRLKLQEGEAFFEVAKAPGRPFFVDTGSSYIKVVGTKFNVDRTDESVRISVLEGTVQIFGTAVDDNAEPLATLGRGDVAEISTLSNGEAQLASLSKGNNLSELSTLAGGWRDGWLAYDGAKLAEIVSDLNRYYAPGISMSDPKLGQLRVTASFKSTRIPQFIESMDNLFPVVAEENSDGSYILKPAD